MNKNRANPTGQRLAYVRYWRSKHIGRSAAYKHLAASAGATLHLHLRNS